MEKLSAAICCVGGIALVVCLSWQIHSTNNLKRDLQLLQNTDETSRNKRAAPADARPSQLTTSFGMGGAMYVRWGRTTCPSDETKLVYHGIGGGGWMDHTGAPSNMLCMTHEPIWGEHNDAWSALAQKAYIYGAEYQPEKDVFPFTKDNAEKIINHNVVCAVCRSDVRVSHVMIPGRNDCYRDWTREYAGYLVSGAHNQKGSSQYLCMDDSPEADEAGYRDENGHLLYNVEAACGSLPCPPYVSGREVPCVVCTK